MIIISTTVHLKVGFHFIFSIKQVLSEKQMKKRIKNLVILNN